MRHEDREKRKKHLAQELQSFNVEAVGLSWVGFGCVTLPLWKLTNRTRSKKKPLKFE